MSSKPVYLLLMVEPFIFIGRNIRTKNLSIAYDRTNLFYKCVYLFISGPHHQSTSHNLNEQSPPYVTMAKSKETKVIKLLKRVREYMCMTCATQAYSNLVTDSGKTKSQQHDAMLINVANLEKKNLIGCHKEV